VKGEDFSYLQFVGLAGDGMLSTVDLPALGTTFEVPIYIVQGEEDLVTRADVTRAYFDRISAPHKRLVLVPRAGHDPNPAMLEAIRALLDHIRSAPTDFI
jgi:pimeloyl-ACP methyl ester carboxylesterase